MTLGLYGVLIGLISYKMPSSVYVIWSLMNRRMMAKTRLARHQRLSRPTLSKIKGVSHEGIGASFRLVMGWVQWNFVTVFSGHIRPWQVALSCPGDSGLGLPWPVANFVGQEATGNQGFQLGHYTGSWRTKWAACECATPWRFRMPGRRGAPAHPRTPCRTTVFRWACRRR